MVNLRPFRLIIGLILVAMVSLACRLSLGSPEKPGDPIPISTEAAGDFEAKIEEAVQQVQQGGSVQISFSEAELTSYVALQLQSQPDLSLSNPQVYLRDEKVQFFADYTSGSVVVPLRVVFIPQVDATGRPNLELEVIDMGAIDVPESVESRIQDQIDQAFLRALKDAGSDLIVETLTVQDGQLSMQGFRR